VDRHDSPPSFAAVNDLRISEPPRAFDGRRTDGWAGSAAGAIPGRAPGCCLEMAWADHLLADVGVRWVAFDRPGYGGSTATAFSVGSVAKMALQVADQYGLERFRTSGWSGGGPFALATAAIAGKRVQAVGVIAGAAPFQLIPGALDLLSDGDRAAERLLPGDPEAASAGFQEGFAMTEALESSAALYEAFEPLLSDTDRRLWSSYSEHLPGSFRSRRRRSILRHAAPWNLRSVT
jgi:pimeloyl-ACP methyl ester carboxylesterase